MKVLMRSVNETKTWEEEFEKEQTLEDVLLIVNNWNRTLKNNEKARVLVEIL